MEKIIGDRRWGHLLLIASLSAICVATIFPFKFVIPEGFSGSFIVNEFRVGSSIKDYWQNVLLFIPFGVAVASTGDRQQRNTLTILIIGFLASTILSTTVELTQFFLPPRVSNVTDIICNSFGGTLGAILYGWRSNIVEFIIGILTANPNKLSLKSLFVAIASYCSLVILGIWILLISVNLSNWDDDFYLALGNEVTGDRPWNGYIENLYISDRDLARSEVALAFARTDAFFAQLPSTIVSLDFTKRQNYARGNNQYLPNLLWQNASSSPQIKLGDRVNNSSETKQAVNYNNRQHSGILVNSKHWLKTEQPAVALNQKLEVTSEFSLLVTIASKELKQVGPARIISLSGGIHAQNLVIGQEGTGLSFRLRTPITGNTPNQPEFIISNVFNNYSDRQILITFAERELTFYIDRADNKYSFVFTPYISFFSYLPWNQANWIINLKNLNASKYRLNFYIIVAIPLVFLAIRTIHYLLLKKLSLK